MQKTVLKKTKQNISYRRLNFGDCILIRVFCAFCFGYVCANRCGDFFIVYTYLQSNDQITQMENEMKKLLQKTVSKKTEQNLSYRHLNLENRSRFTFFSATIVLTDVAIFSSYTHICKAMIMLCRLRMKRTNYCRKLYRKRLNRT